MKYNKQVSFGTDASGKRIRKWFHADTKAELNEMIDNFKQELKRVQNPSLVTFSAYAEHWFETYKAGRSGKTREMYESAIAKCSPLDPYEVRSITKSMCQNVVNQFWKHPRTAEIVAATMRQIFRTAVMDGIIYSSPAERLDLPKASEKKFHLMTDDELKAFDRAKLSDQDRLFVTILRVFGLRPGEALALQPHDFDFRAGVLHITKSLEMTNDNQSKIKTTKTGVSRDIPIPDSMKPYFRKAMNSSGAFLLFPKSDGRYYTKTAYRCLSERILKSANRALLEEKAKSTKSNGNLQYINLIPDVTMYSFRHRRATDLYYLTQQGVISTKQAAALMGHSEFVFLKTYSHIDESREKLSGIYSNSVLPSVTHL